MYLHNKISTDVMRCLATRDGSSFAIAIAISAWTIPMSMAMATKLEPSLLAIYHLFVLSSISSIDIVSIYIQQPRPRLHATPTFI